MKTLITVILLQMSLLTMADNDAKQNAKQLLTDFRLNLTAVQAEFIQYELLAHGEKSDINSGLVWMQQPSLFRWEYQEPYEQLIVADGEQVWVYDEDLEQVTVKAQDNSDNPIYALFNESLSDQHYELAFEKSDETISWIRLTPKVESEEVKYVLLGFMDNNINQIKVLNQFDQTMVFEFHNSLRNPDIDTKLFQFTPPQGVDVIRAMGD